MLRGAALGLLALAAVLPGLWRGGLAPEAQAVACGLCGAALLCAALGARGRDGELRPGPLWLAPALVAVAAALQCLPLPAPLAALLAPASWELRTFPPLPAPGWAPISLDVPATLGALALPVALCCTALAVALLARESRARRVLLVLPIAAGALQAALCLARFAAGEGATGSFVNRNHEAALLVLSALLALGAALDPARLRDAGNRSPRPLFAFVAGLCAAAALLTLSRGAALGLFAGALALLFLRRRPGAARDRWARLAAAAVVVAALGLAAVVSFEGWRERTQGLRTAGPAAEMKLRSFGAAAQVVAEHAGLGVGRGAWRFVAGQHRTVPGDDEYVFVEDEPLQLAAELGVPAALLVLLLLGLAWWRAARGAGDGLERGTVAGALALGLHNLVDFNLEMPGVALPACIALSAALAGALVQARRADAPPPLRGRVRALLVLASLTAGLAIAAALLAAPLSAEADAAALRSAVADPRVSAEALLAQARPLVARHPADWLLSLLPAVGLAQRTPLRLGEALAWVGRAQLLAPRNWRAHAAASSLLLRAGARGQARLETRLGLAGHDQTVQWQMVRLAAQASRGADELLEAVPADPIARSRLVDALRSLRRDGEAEAVALRALAGEGEADATPDPALAAFVPAARDELRLAVAQLALARGDLAAAAQAAAQLPEAHCARALLESQLAAARREPASDVDGHLLRGLTLCPGDRTLGEALVRGRLKRGDAAGALEALGLLRVAPAATGWAVDVHLLRAEALEASGKPARALAERWIAAAMAPSRVELGLDYAERLRAQGDVPGAREALRALIARASGPERDRLRARLDELHR